MDKKRILLLGAMGILLAAAIALGAVWIMEAAEYAGYKADYVDIAEDVLHSDEDDGMIELVPLSPAPKQNDTLDDPTASAATDPRSTAEPPSLHPPPTRTARKQRNAFRWILPHWPRKTAIPWAGCIFPAPRSITLLFRQMTTSIT